jgi:2,4-dienoyl-CoA reductase-like NADH-dependent reductase (Old Yellow Enzyme family)
MVNPIDLEAAGNTIIYRPFETPARLDAFRRLSEAIKTHGSLAIMQISHGGRQTPKWINPNPISASDEQLQDVFGRSFGKPRAMTKEDIKEVIDQVSLRNPTLIIARCLQ